MISKFGLVSSLMLVLTGCEHYARKPLQSEQILASVERQRHLIDAPNPDDRSATGNSQAQLPVPITFMRAVELMKTRSPTLKEVRAEYETAQALALV